MSDARYYQMLAEGELMTEVQRAVKNGWTFSFDYGERKFDNASCSATKGDCVLKSWDSVEELLYQITKKEIETVG